MKTQLNEIKRMQQLAGLIKENQINENNEIIDNYLDDLMQGNMDEDAEEGEEINGVLERNEFGDEEEYEDASQFIPTYNFIKSQGGKYTLEGNPNITFKTLKNGDIAYNYIASFE